MVRNIYIFACVRTITDDSGREMSFILAASAFFAAREYSIVGNSMDRVRR